MPKKSMTLDLPDDLYEHVRQVAEYSQRPIERVVLESMRFLFVPPPASPDVSICLAALPHYADEQLWAVVSQRLAWPQSQRLQALSAKNTLGTLSDNEQRDVDTLLALNDHAMLLRSEALLFLKNRGDDIEAYRKRGV